VSTPAIQVQEVSKQYRRGAREQYVALRDRIAAGLGRLMGRGRGDDPATYFWALRDVSLDIQPGEVVGIVGRNGAGKTTLLKVLARITRPTSGQAVIRGRVGSLLEVGAGFHPELTGRENVYLNGAILGMTRREIGCKFDEIVAFSEVGEFLDTPLKRYSSGMRVRLAFAVAAHLEPEILFVDEVLAVGDLNFQKKSLGKMGEVARGGRTILFVSHQMNQIRRLCQKVIWLDGGTVRDIGPTGPVLGRYEAAMLAAGADPTRANATYGKAAFLSWRILDPRADHEHAVGDWDPISVAFDVQVNEPLQACLHGVALFDDDGRLMWANAFDGVCLEPGRRALTHKIQGLPLKPGNYNWRVSLYGDSGQIDVWSAVPVLTVSAAPVTHPRDEWQGVLNIPSRFDVSSGEAG
jgi:homopolymeric O-antigen transport system ATP-binding protein